MLIAIDIDDVLVDFINCLLEYHNKTYNTSLTKEKIHTYRFWEIWGGNREESIKKIRDFKETDIYGNIRPFSKAIESMNLLKENHKLVIVTSRSTIEETKIWINKHFPNIFDNIYFSYNYYTKEGSKTKSEICKELNVDILIEDSLDYARECSDKGIKVFLFDAPWNQCEELPENIIRVKDWNEILSQTLKSTR